MTIICAMHEPGVGTWIGSDTQTSFGSLKHRFGPKWILSECGTMALGLSGLNRARYLIEGIDGLFTDSNPRRVANSIREAIKADEWKPREGEGESVCWSVGAIFATATGYWPIGSDFTVMPPSIDGYWAEGSGEQFALGAAYSGVRNGNDPETIVSDMVDAAMAFDTGCGGQCWTHLLRLSQ